MAPPHKPTCPYVCERWRWKFVVAVCVCEAAASASKWNPDISHRAFKSNKCVKQRKRFPGWSRGVAPWMNICRAEPRLGRSKGGSTELSSLAGWWWFKCVGGLFVFTSVRMCGSGNSALCLIVNFSQRWKWRSPVTPQHPHPTTSRLIPRRDGFQIATLAKWTGIGGIKWRFLVYRGMCSLPYICFLHPRFLLVRRPPPPPSTPHILHIHSLLLTWTNERKTADLHRGVTFISSN